MTPARTRARRMPKRRPARTMDMAEARLWGGARSAARGMRICGVTVKTPTRKEREMKAVKELVTARPMVKAVETKTKRRSRGRRRTRSPRGESRRRPVAYLQKMALSGFGT